MQCNTNHLEMCKTTFYYVKRHVHMKEERKSMCGNNKHLNLPPLGQIVGLHPQKRGQRHQYGLSVPVPLCPFTPHTHASLCAVLPLFLFSFHLLFPPCRRCMLSPLVVSDSLQPIDCSPPGPSVLGILQARILEWVPIPFSRGSSLPRD